jgi:hypothetical protein
MDTPKAIKQAKTVFEKKFKILPYYKEEMFSGFFEGLKSKQIK